MPRGRTEATAEVWRDRVQRWKQSGLTAKEFSEREGLSRPGALSWWQYRLKQQDAESVSSSATPPLKLVRLEPVRGSRKRKAPSRPSRKGDGAIAIVCGAHRVLVGEEFNDAQLRRVLDVLEARR